VPPIPLWRFGPNGRSNEPEGLIESLLFGTGRHLFLVPDELKAIAATIRQRRRGVERQPRVRPRARQNPCPNLHRAKKVGVLVVEVSIHTEADASEGERGCASPPGTTASMPLKYRATGEDDEIAEVLIAECRRLDANLLVMGKLWPLASPRIVAGQHDRSDPASFAVCPLLIAH